MWVFPRLGLVHFQLNGGEEKAVSVSTLNSQNPGGSRWLLPCSVPCPPLRTSIVKGEVEKTKNRFQLTM